MQKEKSKQTPHKYKVGGQILLKTDCNTKFGKNSFNVNDNGTIQYQIIAL